MYFGFLLACGNNITNKHLSKVAAMDIWQVNTVYLFNLLNND